MDRPTEALIVFGQETFFKCDARPIRSEPKGPIRFLTFLGIELFGILSALQKRTFQQIQVPMGRIGRPEDPVSENSDHEGLGVVWNQPPPFA